MLEGTKADAGYPPRWKFTCPKCGKPVLMSESHVNRLKASGSYEVLHFACAYPEARSAID